MAWSLDIQGPNGGANIVTGAPFRSARVAWTVEGPGSVEIDLREADVTDDWTPGNHRVVVNGDHDFTGYLTRLHRVGPPEELVYSASALGLAYILDWRLVRHATTLVDDVDVIVEWLLDEAQTQLNGDMGFAMGTVVGTLPSRTRIYCFGVVIGEAIRELSHIGRGFDWEIAANGDLNVWADTRGVDTGLTLAEAQTNEWEIELDTSELITTVSAIGDPSQPFGPIHDMTRHVGAAITYGRHEIVIDVDSTDHDELIDAARAELKVGGGGLLRLHVGWWSDRGPWDLGDVWLQDTVTVTLPDFFTGDQDMRCTDVAVSIEPMPPAGGGDPLYYVEQSFDALVTDIEDGDPDEAS